MMDIIPLNLTHQELLQSRFNLLNLPLSEYSFSNLYLFRDIHEYEVMKIDFEIFVKGKTRDQTPFVMLTSHPAKIPPRILNQALSGSTIIFPIPDEWLNLLEKRIIQSYYKDDDTDYIFTQKKLATYSGRHLDGKRNQVNQLLTQNQVKFEKMNNQMNDALQILDAWNEEHRENGKTDYLSCKEALHYFELLNLKGLVVYVNEKPAGIIIGESCSKDYFTVHFSKAIGSIKGIYQYLFQQLAISLDGLCSWINLEQDLGIPSLRKSKLSYHPDLLIKKWRIKLSSE